MESQKEDKTSLQENFLWTGLFCLAFSFVLDTTWAARTFGDYLGIARLINAGFMYSFFAMSARRTFQLFGRIFKAADSIKKGEDEPKKD